jgi:hypothetical protein
VNSGEEPSLESELVDLRSRLEILERNHHQEVSTLRWDITQLELKALARRATPLPDPPASPPPPLPPVPPDPEPEVTVAGVSEAIPEEISYASKEEPPPASAPAQRPPAPIADPEKFEQQFGRVWLVRLGIALLVTGLVLLGNYAYQNWVRELPAGVRLAALYACAGLLIESGRRLALRPRLKNFGEVVLGGGLAFGYYCTFAAHHVARLRVIESPVLAAVLLFFAAVAIGGISWQRQARTTAMLAFLLASYSTMLQPIGWLSSVSSFLLAAGGVSMMLRPGWAGPGVASLVATYAAFFGWQVLGASRGQLTDPAVLWFLPPVWLMFSLPGATGHFDSSLSDRARAWFTGANNGTFFLLFSSVWLTRGEPADYWQVPALCGTVLVALGAAGRRQERTAGGVNLAQGIALLSLALALKLEGNHLVLALAGESLLLSLAFFRFKGKSEIAFAALAGGAACFLIFRFMAGSQWEAVPVWSSGVTALLVATAAVVLRQGVNGLPAPQQPLARAASAIVFFAAAITGAIAWCMRLPGEWPVPVATAAAVALGAAFAFPHATRRMPEVAAGALIFLLAATYSLPLADSPLALAATLLLALAGTWIWHRRDGAQDEVPGVSFLAWAHSAFTAIATALFMWNWLDTHPMLHPAVALILWILTAAAVALRCHRLPPCLAVLALINFLQLWIDQEGGILPAFLVAALSLATVFTLKMPLAEQRLAPDRPTTIASHLFFRTTAFGSFCVAWIWLAPASWGDWLAASALLLALAAHLKSWRPPLEIAGLIVVVGLWLAFESLSAPWHKLSPPVAWRGGIVAAVAIILPLLTRKSWAQAAPERQALIPAFIAIGCAAASIWATQMLVWRHDWPAVSVLWSILGFITVSAGLWLRLVVFRQVGFALLALAILKVFAVDVWDFTAFMRVVSFIVLGAALTLLGLFYNRFMPAMKRLLDEGAG